MTRSLDLLTTAMVPVVWGTTYIVTTEMLPDGFPITVAMLRALPAGLLLLLIARQLPPLRWVPKVLVLGALNISIFLTLLFVAAYRLPGGLAATLTAIQPLMVLVFSRILLGALIQPAGVAAALAGIVGVGLLVLGPEAFPDPIGIAAALGAALSMAAGNVLASRWQPSVSPLTFTGWQLTAGGMLLLPLALLIEPDFPVPDPANLAGLIWLGLIGGALAYVFWFRGIARLGPPTVTAFSFLSPLSAVVLGWAVLGQALTPLQGLGAFIILTSVWFGQRAGRRATATANAKGATA
ncbi:putative blue pigment (indigoidine) exporter [Natronospira proteinivora]|uniref:Blue pigment (Indigoidine) exporter n=1 Tax=Natronospira proteinivora TaxID=1807133 RepID=A0ABT1G5K8_9GAMM|nr:EamA family transporter [Natronospira proteinivora]MCP1726587.1 putative blue pigment (indigoidine) exporter [Natronospira proteinivora]